MKRINGIQRTVLAIAVLLITHTSLWALGFRNPDQDARATGQGEAFVAQADDASAIYYNPGGLTQLAGTQVTVGMAVGFPSWKYTGAGGSDEMSKNYILPHFYVATDCGLENWRFGIGCNIPFGNAAEYSANGPLASVLTQAEMTIYNIAPTVAYRFNEHLSLGVALNIYSGTTMTASMPYGLGTQAHFRGDGTAAGATVGLLWTINTQHSIGVVYRSPFSIDFAGSAQLAPFDTAPVSANTRIDFPQSVAVGYAFHPIKQWKLEVDIEWTNWDTLNTVVLHAPGSLMNNQAVPFNWKDSFFYEFGTQYQINDTWTTRAGYIFSANTVPDQTVSASVPDSNRHVFSVGAGYQNHQLNVDITYQYSLSEDRNVIDSVNSPNGQWASSGHAVLITSTWKF